KTANNMIDDQPATTYTFAGSDTNPTVVFDLGKVCDLRRLSAIYSPGKDTVDFYVLKTLPLEAPNEKSPLIAAALQKGASTPTATAGSEMELPATLPVTTSTVNNLKSVGSVANGDTEGRASVDFPETSGRYILIKWNPTAPSDKGFSVAEVAAFG